MLPIVFALSLIAALSCGRPPPLVAPTPPSAFDGPLRLLSHADDPLELLVFERPASRPFVAAAAAVLAELNRTAAESGASPIALTVLRWKRDRHDPVPLDSDLTPVERLEVDVRFDVWLQDFVEISAQHGETVLLDPQHTSGGLERIAPFLAERWNARWVRLPRDAAGSANGAGNLEVLPDDRLLLGSTVGPGLAEFLFERGYRERHVRVDTSFLEIGHVDEIVSHVVTGRGACDFSLVRASPGLAMRHAEADPAPPRWLRKRIGSERFTGTQRAIERRVSEAVEQVRARVAEACPAPSVVALPVLFDCKGPPDAPHRCRSTRPNPVNMTVLRRHLLIPDPEYAPFQAAVRQALQAAGQVPHLLPAGFYQERRGGIHCATNVRRDPGPLPAAGLGLPGAGSHLPGFPILSGATRDGAEDSP